VRALVVEAPAGADFERLDGFDHRLELGERHAERLGELRELALEEGVPVLLHHLPGEAVGVAARP